MIIVNKENNIIFNRFIELISYYFYYRFHIYKDKICTCFSFQLLYYKSFYLTPHFEFFKVLGLGHSIYLHITSKTPRIQHVLLYLGYQNSLFKPFIKHNWQSKGLTQLLTAPFASAVLRLLMQSTASPPTRFARCCPFCRTKRAWGKKAAGPSHCKNASPVHFAMLRFLLYCAWKK